MALPFNSDPNGIFQYPSAFSSPYYTAPSNFNLPPNIGSWGQYWADSGAVPGSSTVGSGIWDDENSAASQSGAGYVPPAQGWNPFKSLYNGVTGLFGNNASTIMPFGDEWMMQQGVTDPSALTAQERSDWYRNYQNQQGLGLAREAMGWGKWGTILQGIGAIASPFFQYKNYQLAKENMRNLNEANKNRWNAFVTNTNDRVAATNYNRLAVGGRNALQMRQIDKHGNPM